MNKFNNYLHRVKEQLDLNPFLYFLYNYNYKCSSMGIGNIDNLFTKEYIEKSF